MTVIHNSPQIQVALVAQPPLAGMVALALASLEARVLEMPLSDVGRAGCDFAVLDEALADGAVDKAIERMALKGKPVLVLVRNHGVNGAIRAIHAGATEVLRVPFDPAELVVRASAAIYRATGKLPKLDGVRSIGRVKINVIDGAMELDGSTKHLTPLERGLLYVLIANAGRVVSREEIIDCVWGAEAAPNSNLVDRHIRDLRRKLQDDWRRPSVLATMRGQGYMVPLSD
ncbi:MAG TPA: response regulator transcription factor [Candidatus Limnocylindria bacterium]|jgi:DNA-binding response OmpR family regulator|nr:response regulator transcription factor [Candidatus Limnocylindria bacterium]